MFFLVFCVNRIKSESYRVNLELKLKKAVPPLNPVHILRALTDCLCCYSEFDRLVGTSDLIKYFNIKPRKVNNC